jgi:hypothetical protein
MVLKHKKFGLVRYGLVSDRKITPESQPFGEGIFEVQLFPSATPARKRQRKLDKESAVCIFNRKLANLWGGMITLALVVSGPSCVYDPPAEPPPEKTRAVVVNPAADRPASPPNSTQSVSLAKDSNTRNAPPVPTLAGWLHDATFVGEVRVMSVVGRKGTMGRAEVEAIWTDVTFETLNVIKDTTEAKEEGSLTLSFLGGEVDGVTLSVSNAPRFREQEEMIIIAKHGQRPYPTYLGTAGVLRVVDGKVFTYENTPVVGADGMQLITAPYRDTLPRRAPLPVPRGDTLGRAVPMAVAIPAEPLSVEETLDRLDALLSGAH